MGILQDLKMDLVRRSKKAGKLTASEKKNLGRLRDKIKKSPKKLQKRAKNIDFGRALGGSLPKKIKKRKTTKIKVKKGKKGRYIIELPR